MTVTYTKFGSLDVNVDGIIRSVSLAQFCAVDSELHAVAARAMEQPGEPVLVPSKSYAKGLRPRNSRVYSKIIQ
jgi:hypothetical protein